MLIGAAERFVAVDLQRKPLFRPICGHFVLVPRSIVPSGFAAWLRSQVKNIRFGGKHLLYQNEVVHFRIRSLLRFRGISPQKARSSGRMKQISRSTKMYCARIKTEVSICATAADMMRLRVRRAVDRVETRIINNANKQNTAKECAFA